MQPPVFELSQAKARLTSYTPRRELHGEDPKPAATLRFDVTLSADDLAMFSPTLRHSLYCKNENAQGQTDAVNALAAANDVRYPEISKPLAWKKEIIGAELRIDYGLGGDSDIILPMSDVDEFSIDAQPGGMVVVAIRIACHPDKTQSGNLAFMIGRDVEISLAPPSPVEHDLAGEKPKRQSKKEARESAEQAFH